MMVMCDRGKALDNVHLGMIATGNCAPTHFYLHINACAQCSEAMSGASAGEKRPRGDR